jgi:hypothetical protein
MGVKVYQTRRNEQAFSMNYFSRTAIGIASNCGNLTCFKGNIGSLVETICRVDYSTTSNHKIKSHQLGFLFLAVDSLVAEDVLK